MNQKHIWLVILFFALGIFFFAHALFASWYILLFAGLCIFLAKPCFGSPRFLSLLLAVFLCGAGYAFIRSHLTQKDLFPYVNQEVSLLGTVIEARAAGVGQYTAILTLDYINGKQTSGKVYLFSSKRISYGDSLRVRGVLTTPSRKRAGTDFDQRKWLCSEGIYYTMSPKSHHDIEILPSKAKSSVLMLPFRLRSTIISAIEKSHRGNAAAFALAIFSGKKGETDAAFDTALSRTGLAHVTAVSGLHVSMLMLLLFSGMGLLPERWRFLRLLAPIVVVFFVLMVGTPASAVRAGSMQILYIFARVLRRNISGPHALFLVAGGMLLYQPFYILNIGFLLSFAAVLGIFLFSEPLSLRLLPRRNGRIKSILIMTLSAQSFALPLCVYYFGNIPLLGLLGNFVLIPLLPFYMGLGFVYILFYALVPSLAFTALLGTLLSLFSEGAVSLLLFLSRLPLCGISVPAPPVFFLLLCFLFVLGLRFKLRRQRLWLAGAFSAVFAATVFLCAYLTPSVTVFNVGEGQIITLSQGDTTIMLDCGAKSRSIDINLLLAQNHIRDIDALILTRLSNDHINRAEALLATGKVHALYLPKAQKDSTPREQDYTHVFSGIETDYASDAEEAASTQPTTHALALFAAQRGVAVTELTAPFDQNIADFRFLITPDSQALEVTAIYKKTRFFFPCDNSTATQPCHFLCLPKTPPSRAALLKLSPTWAVRSDAASFDAAPFSASETKVRCTADNGSITIYFLPWFSFCCTK